MKPYANQIDNIRNMISWLHKDLKTDYPGNVHIERAIECINDELLILEQRIPKAAKDA